MAKSDFFGSWRVGVDRPVSGLEVHKTNIHGMDVAYTLDEDGDGREYPCLWAVLIGDVWVNAMDSLHADIHAAIEAEVERQLYEDAQA